MAKSFDVVTAGIIVVDHVAAPVDRLPDAGQLVLTDDCLLSIGGCAANVAVDLSKIGVPNTICGCVGEDAFGDFASRFLENHGVDLSGMTTCPGVSTSQTLIINVKGQDRRFIHHKGANDKFQKGTFQGVPYRDARVLYVGGFFLMDLLTGADLAEVFADAKRHGVVTALDVVTAGPGDYLRELEKVLPLTDVFLPNNDEGKLMTGEDDPIKQAAVFRELGAKTAVITCGKDGSVLLSEDDRLKAGAFPVDFVDGTGGGDAFDAGYIAGLLQGGDPKRCLTLGSALGASCVRQSGATDGVFNKEQAEQFIQANVLTIDEF